MAQSAAEKHFVKQEIWTTSRLHLGNPALGLWTLDSHDILTGAGVFRDEMSFEMAPKKADKKSRGIGW